MTTVTSRSSQEPIPACVPEPGPAVSGSTSATRSTPAAPVSAVSARARTEVEEYRANDKNQSRVGKALEEGFARELSQMPLGSRAEISLQGRVQLEFAGELKAKVEVKRREEDGAYLVSFKGGLGVGLAASTGGGESLGASASAMVGVQGGTTFVFGSAAEAADRLAAFTQMGALSSVPGLAPGAMMLGLVDGDLADRSVRALNNARMFELGLYGELKGELEGAVAKVGGRLAGEVTLKLDVEAGKLVYEASAQAQLEGSLGAPPEDVLSEKLGPALGGSVERRTTIRAELTVKPEDVKRIKEGTLRPQELLSREHLKLTLSDELNAELASPLLGQSVGLSLKRDVDLNAPGAAERLTRPMEGWSVAAMTREGKELELDVAVATVKGSVSLEKPLPLGDSRTLGLEEVPEALRNALTRAERDEQLLQAQRARLALHR